MGGLTGIKPLVRCEYNRDAVRNRTGFHIFFCTARTPFERKTEGGRPPKPFSVMTNVESWFASRLAVIACVHNRHYVC